jgi:hypothetical protein
MVSNSNDFNRATVPDARTVVGTGYVQPLHRLHWGGILAGSLTGLVTYITLGLLGVAIGFGVAANLTDIRGLGSIGIGGIIWLVLSLAAASFLAGLVTARASTDLNMARGRFNGVITGIVMSAVLTLITLNGLNSAANSASNVVSTAVNATATGASGIASGVNNAGGIEGLANQLGLGSELQALQNGLNRNEISQIIADSSPELNATQVDATAATIESIANNAARNLGDSLSNVSNLGDVVTRQADAIAQALQGDQFATRLRNRGLSQAQAQEVVTVIGQRVTELRQQAQAVQAQAAEAAKATAGTLANAIWVWLLAVGITLAAATFGGGMGASDRGLVRADGTTPVERA